MLNLWEAHIFCFEKQENIRTFADSKKLKSLSSKYICIVNLL